MGHWEESVIQVILSMWLTVENHRLKLRMSEPKLQVILIPNRCERLKFQCASFFASKLAVQPAFSSACGSCTRNSRCVCVSIFARSQRKSGDQRCSFAKTAHQSFLAVCRNSSQCETASESRLNGQKHCDKRSETVFGSAAVRLGERGAQSKQLSVAWCQVVRISAMIFLWNNSVVFMLWNDRSFPVFGY